MAYQVEHRRAVSYRAGRSPGRLFGDAGCHFTVDFRAQGRVDDPVGAPREVYPARADAPDESGLGCSTEACRPEAATSPCPLRAAPAADPYSDRSSISQAWSRACHALRRMV